MLAKILPAVFAAMIFSSVCLTGCAERSEAQPPPMEMVIPVVGFKAVKQPIAEKIFLIGNLEANEVVEIKSEIDGAVEEINFEEGQKVSKGDLLFLIDQSKLKASLAQSQANLKLAETTNKRYESLIETRAISRQEFDQAAAALEINQAALDLDEAQLRDATITAPFDGIMGERLISVGQFITTGTSLSSLINQDPIKASFRISERYLSRIKEGQMVEMKVAAYPEDTFSGQVYFVGPQIDELTRTALIKAKVPNSDGKLRHGMFANLLLTVNEKADTIVVPETALVLKGDNVEVYTVNAEDKVEIKSVEVGIRLAGFVELTHGISEGDIVVVEGYQKLGPGVKVSVRYEDEENASSTPQVKEDDTTLPEEISVEDEINIAPEDTIIEEEIPIVPEDTAVEIETPPTDDQTLNQIKE